MIFTQELMSQGQEGGLAAARKLTERVRQFISTSEGFEQYQLWVYLFYNKRGLLETFGRVGLTTVRAKFDDFMMGFNQAAERFIMVDVGGSKEAADAKLKGELTRVKICTESVIEVISGYLVHLEDNIRLPHTYKIFFGGMFYLHPRSALLIFDKQDAMIMAMCTTFVLSSPQASVISLFSCLDILT
jgi:hypothetical protein